MNLSILANNNKLVNNIQNNRISKIDAKKDLNTLNKIKNGEIIKHKRRTSKHKELLTLFNDLLDTILTDKTLKSESQEGKNENESEIIGKSKSFEEQIKLLKKMEDLKGFWPYDDFDGKEVK